MANRYMAVAAAALSVAVANAGSWNIIAQNIGTFSTGISFNSDGKTGFLAVGVNGVGAEVLKSTDGGKTWSRTSDPTELMILDVTSYGNYVAASGALAADNAQYSVDGGNTFNTSTVLVSGAGAAQCIRNVGPHDSPLGFGMVGDFGLFNPEDGVAISMDGGKTYVPYNITNLNTDARYGSFPTANNWYVSGGQWPGEGQDDQPADQTTSGSGGPSGEMRVNARTSIVNTPQGFRYLFEKKGVRAMGRNAQAVNGSYVAQIVQSADGGKTWASTFFRNNWGYLNGIDCLDASRCCVAAENDDQAGFAAILCTQNGGKTWTQNYYTNVTGSSLMDIRVVGTDGYWAVGGIMSEIGASASFLYSADAGQTWTVDSTIDGVSATSVDCAQGTQECWATLIDVDTQEASVAYAATV